MFRYLADDAVDVRLWTNHGCWYNFCDTVVGSSKFGIGTKSISGSEGAYQFVSFSTMLSREEREKSGPGTELRGGGPSIGGKNR